MSDRKGVGKSYVSDFKTFTRKPGTVSDEEFAEITKRLNAGYPKQKGQKMAKTMYDTHLDRDGVSTPIFMLEDNHLENIIRVKISNFIRNREKFSEAPKSADPMIMAMGRTEVWSPEKLAMATKAVLEDVQPYLAEALVRGNPSIINQATISMRLLAKREDRFVMPAALANQIEDQSEDDLDVQEGF